MASDFTVDRNSPKYVLGADGYLKEYANDEPAIEFNADGSYKGVLVEPESTNFALDSEDWSTANWDIVGTSATISENDDISPDGNTTANRFTGTGNQNYIIIKQNHTFDSSGVWTISVFAKKSANCDTLLLLLNGYTLATGTSGYFDLDTGNVTGLTSEIKEYPNGWYRCSVTATIDSGDLVGEIRLYATPSLGSSTWASSGDASGKELYGWGLHIEKSPIATSYIPTTTVAVTRVKDDIYLTSASSLIGQTEGTMFVEVDWRDSGASQYILGISDGTANNRIEINNSNDNLRIRASSDGTTIINNVGGSSTSFTGIQKIALAYADDDFKLFNNSSIVTSVTSADISSMGELNEVAFGQLYSPILQANMWIRTVALYTSRLTDTKCQELTTL